MFNLTIPVFIFGSLVSGLIGSIIHLIFGGKLIRLIFSIMFSWVGFWVGNNFAEQLDIIVFRYGQLNIGFAVIVSFIIGLLGYWISGKNQGQ
ncbi:MAG: hypothetical protein J7L66_05645 [Anaerolineaceae bacterium]|nr:hypothetical protein [Anaerolineaceae bacterium]